MSTSITEDKLCMKAVNKLTEPIEKGDFWLSSTAALASDLVLKDLSTSMRFLEKFLFSSNHLSDKCKAEDEKMLYKSTWLPTSNGGNNHIVHYPSCFVISIKVVL